MNVEIGNDGVDNVWILDNNSRKLYVLNLSTQKITCVKLDDFEFKLGPLQVSEDREGDDRYLTFRQYMSFGPTASSAIKYAGGV
jgi:hypothetical protein